MFKRLALITSLVLANSAMAGEWQWQMVKAKDTNPQGVNNYLAQVDSDELKAVTSGRSSPEFLHLRNILVIDPSGVLRKSTDYLNQGRRLMSGELYVRVSQIIDITPVHPAAVLELDVAARP